MAAPISYKINDFDYAELSNNYDAMYDTLVGGGVVWLRLNYNNSSKVASSAGADKYIRFMITEWYMSYDGLVVVCPDRSELIFTNSSHTPVMSVN